MNDSNGGALRRPLQVLAIIERKDRPSVWVKVGAAFTNRDGSTTLLLDAFPIGTNKLQIREERERDFAPRAANGNGLAAAPYAGNGHAAGEEAES
jgi:hypothetical protein